MKNQPMEIPLPIGDELEILTVPDSWKIKVIHPVQAPNRDFTQIVDGALAFPLNAPPFPRFISEFKYPLVVVNDATRPTPTASILKAIYPYLRERQTRFLVATGSHRAPTEGEYRLIFGDIYETVKNRIFAHDAKKSPCRFLGRTGYGNEIWLNGLLWEADVVIPVGSIEPHYFAGYTGGRKSLMPGVARYDSIEANHHLAVSSSAKPLVIEGNPVAEDLAQAEALMADTFNIFAIMTVLDGGGRLYAAAAGDLMESFRLLLPRADELFVAPVDEEADIIVTVTRPPLDIDLYQSQKSLENVRHVLRSDGIIILVSACRQGVGPAKFLELLDEMSSPEAIMERVKSNYKLGYHKAGKIVELTARSQVWAVTKLPDDLVLRARMRPVKRVARAVEEAVKVKGTQANILIVMDGGITVPIAVSV